MKKHHLKGFSLFEILIVLIILILVIGISYPYWSSAIMSAQKTTTLSHLKQLSQCAFFYLNDNEGKLPSGYVKTSSGGIEIKGQVPIPAVFPPKSPNFKSEHALHWANQIFIYAKQPEIYTAPGFIEVGRTSNEPCVAFTYNGLLHEYSLNQVSEPASVPIFWCGLGNIALAGKAFTNPYLISLVSDDNKPIKYGDSQVASTLVSRNQIINVVARSYGSFWIYGKSSPMVFLDGSARTVKIPNSTNVSNGSNYPCICDANGIPIIQKKSIRHADFFIPR